MKKNLSTWGTISTFVYLFSIFILLSNSPLMAQEELLNKEVRIESQSTAIKNLLQQIEQKSGINFTFGNNIPLNKVISIEGDTLSIKRYLELIFKDEKVEFIEKNKKILIFPSNESDKLKPVQTIRGYVLDIDSKIPLAGVNIVISADDYRGGTISNEDGTFLFENVPVGRYYLKFSYIGYKQREYPNLNLNSAKEMVLNVELEELTVQLGEVLIKPIENRLVPTNDLASVSSRSFSSLEMENYPGAMMDISRAVVTFPGVVATYDGRNHIAIRGNSPKGLQWRLEGVEIPNLNHFAEIGSAGGGIGIISNNMLAGSEFYTGAFPAEFGNALSGVFDLKLRNGNSDKHEQTFQVGVIGTELFAEGPLNRQSGASYIGQYRYATFDLIKKVIKDINSIPEFQDLSFKLHLPTKKMGVFSVFGIAGLSHEYSDTKNYDWNSNMSTFGITNNYIINQKSHLNTIFSFSTWDYKWDEFDNIGTSQNPIDYISHSKVAERTTKISINLNRKINARHKIKSGIIIGNTSYNSLIGWHSDTLYNKANDSDHPFYDPNTNYEGTYSDDKGSAYTAEIYANWKYLISENLTLNSGVHYLKFYLNNKYSLEPRFGLNWQFLPKHSLNAGYGIHSRKESLSLYTGQRLLPDGEYVQSNKNLELTKSENFVLGYNFLITNDLLLKIEAYYQYLYDIPVFPFPDYFSTINFEYGFEGNILVNKGKGYNKGIELTLEKFFNRGYYFMFNGSLYDSKYIDYRGLKFDTRYNGSYTFNGILQREYKVGKNKQNQLGVNTRIIYAGGLRYLPIDLELSRASGHMVTTHQYGYTEQADDYFRIDLQLSYKRNKPKYSSEWRLDIINLTANKNMHEMKYNSLTQTLIPEYQNLLIPMLAYKIMF